MSEEHYITQASAGELARGGAVREAVAVYHGEDGWLLNLRVGMNERTLRKRHGLTPRAFGSLDAVGRMARRLGIARLLVDLSGWDDPDVRRRR